MERVVELRQFGQLDLDDVLVNGRRVALLPRAEGAVMRLVAAATPAEAEELRLRAAQIREEQKRPPISERIMGVPNATDIRALEKKRKVAK